jgi:uncharacterized protein (TIGR02996 family)
MNEETFLSALHESPNDEVTWSALADWLEEDGQAERADLVRIVRRLHTLPVTKRTKARAALEDRVASLLASGVRPVVPQMVNSIGMRFALIPPGHFRMGSPRGESCRCDNEAAHEVAITRPFYLGVFPVTQRQYKLVMKTNPSHFRRTGEGKFKVKDIADEELGNFPVERVSWSQAQQFLQRMTNLKEEQRASRIYRLPTEAEWEYAARAGTTTPFHSGDSLSSTQANFCGNDPYGGAEKGPYLERTCAVGSYRPNAFGLYDMDGNLWQWCSDWLGQYTGPETDPTGPPEGTTRSVRGGSWIISAQFSRAAYRNWCSPSSQAEYLGFRVAAVRSAGD